VSTRSRGAFVLRLIGILICGGTAGVAAWALVTLAGLDGLVAALVAAVVAMVGAAGLWALGIVLLRAFGAVK